MIDDRLRAALLWDQPALLRGHDIGTRQWHRALQLDFVELGDLVETDVLSIAAHAVYAAMSGDQSRLADLRIALRSRGGADELFERLLGLGLSLDDPEVDRVALNRLHELVSEVADADLRARLFVRLIAFAESRGARDLSRPAAEQAIAATSGTTRLGVVARRWGAQFGIDEAQFNPWVTDTPDDPLLTLPWIQRRVIAAAAALAAGRLEKRLAGVWDSTLQIGKTKLDDLFVAHVQSEWCGALELRSNIRRLMSTEILTNGDQTQENVRWALVVWASEPSAKRVTAAIQQAERQLEPVDAAELLEAVHRDGSLADAAKVDVAAGVWDILEDGDVDGLLEWLPNVGSDRTPARWNSVVRALLWRRPTSWQGAFVLGDATTRTRMVDALHPRDLVAAPGDLLEALAQHAAKAAQDSTPRALAAALQFATNGVPLSDAQLIRGGDALRLLDWNRASVMPEVVRTLVVDLTAASRQRLRDAAAGKLGFGDADVDQLLGGLASYLEQRPRDVVDALLSTCRHPASAAEWQLGALEGLVALRRAGHLNSDDIEAVRDLALQPGPGFLGEEVSVEAMHAEKIHVLAPDVNADDVAWLAVCARGSDVRARLIAMVALGAIDSETTTVDWSLVGGLFDPDDDVVIRAVGSIGRRGLSPSSGATPVARHRLRDLAAAASAGVRREVVVTAAGREELALRDVVEGAQGDRAWTVRREAAHSGQDNEPASDAP
jgi:hypothetical protein